MTVWSVPEEDVAADVHMATGARYAARTVALVGFMGAGKSSVGRQLAHVLGRPFLDTDSMVERAAGRLIPDIFAEDEAIFRRFEEEAVSQALASPPCVVALGGGSFERPANYRPLLAQALVVHIHVPWKVLREQLPGLVRGRPVISDLTVSEIHDLYLRRCAGYRRAHLRLSVPRTSVEDAVGVIAQVLGTLPPQAVQD